VNDTKHETIVDYIFHNGLNYATDKVQLTAFNNKRISINQSINNDVLPWYVLLFCNDQYFEV